MKSQIKIALIVIFCCLSVQQAKSLPNTSLTNDPNESGVTDDRDFKGSKVWYSNGGIHARIAFHAAPNLGQFWFYISVDGDAVADFGVYCTQASFSVKEIVNG